MSETAVARSKRPLSIWFLALANGLLAIFMIAASFKAVRVGFTPLQAVFTGVVGVGISLSAHLTWYGKRYGRNALLVLLTVFLGLLLAQNLRTVVWAVQTGTSGFYLWQGVAWAVFCLLWLAVNFRLLLGRRARAFYG